jgi:hypothetical protein
MPGISFLVSADAVIFTLDDDFRIYRRHGNKVIPVLMPED